MFSSVSGTCHGDDFWYLFHTEIFTLLPQNVNKDDAEFMKMFTKLWTDFAKTGTVPSFWKQFKEHNGVYPYLDLGAEPKLINELPIEKIKFWRELEELVFKK